MKIPVADVEIGAWVAHPTYGFVAVEYKKTLPTGDIEVWYKAVVRDTYGITTYTSSAVIEVME